MKINKLFLFAMGLVAVGCNDSQIEEQSLINDVQGEAVEVVLEGVVDNAVGSQARSVASVTDAGAVRIEFDDTDAIGVYLNNEKVGLTHENVKFTVKSTERDANGDVHATFTTSEPMILLGAGNNVYAYYPYEATETEFEGTSRSTDRGAWDGYHWFNIPAEQVQAGLGDYSNLAEYVHLYAPERQLAKQGNKVVVAAPGLQFRHAFAYVTLNLKNSYERPLNITKATVKFFKDGEPVALAGDFAVALDDAQMATEGLAAVVAGENVQNVVTVSAPTAAGLELAGEENSWIPVAIAPATLDAAEVTVETVDGFVYKQNLEFNSAVTIAQNQSQPINFTLSDESLSTIVTNNDVAEYMLQMNEKNIVLDLACDITLDVYAGDSDAFGGDRTETIEIKGNGHTITFNKPLNENFSDVDVANNAKLFIKDAQLTNTNNNTASNCYKHHIEFACEVDLNNVTSDKAIMLMNSANLNKVEIEDVYPNDAAVDAYALWIMPTVEGQTVTVDNCVFKAAASKSADRGIKIDGVHFYEYNSVKTWAPTAVTLNVKNSTFSTQKKAAVLVATLSGATINIDNVNISGVAADKTNHVWIDSVDAIKNGTTDYFAYGKTVTVNGAGWKFEDADWSVKADGQGVAVNNNGLHHAIAYGIDVVKVADGEYTLPDVVTGDRSIVIFGNTLRKANFTLDGIADFGESHLALQSVTLTSANKLNGVKAESTVYSSVAINGALSLYGKKAQVLYSTINLNAKDADGATLAKNAYLHIRSVDKADITGCTFNTFGRAIEIYNYNDEDGNAVNDVTVKNCKFYASQPATTQTGIGTGQNCAAIEINNSSVKDAGAAHKLTTSGNKVYEGFSGEWRIFNYIAIPEGEGDLTVNGVAYDGWYLDGKKVVKLPNGSIELQ